MTMDKQRVFELMEKYKIKRRHNSPHELWCLDMDLLAFAHAIEQSVIERLNAREQQLQEEFAVAQSRSSVGLGILTTER